MHRSVEVEVEVEVEGGIVIESHPEMMFLMTLFTTFDTHAHYAILFALLYFQSTMSFRLPYPIPSLNGSLPLPLPPSLSNSCIPSSTCIHTFIYMALYTLPFSL